LKRKHFFLFGTWHARLVYSQAFHAFLNATKEDFLTFMWFRNKHLHWASEVYIQIISQMFQRNNGKNGPAPGILAACKTYGACPP